MLLKDCRPRLIVLKKMSQPVVIRRNQQHIFETAGSRGHAFCSFTSSSRSATLKCGLCRPHLRDLAAAQDEAVRESGNLLKGGPNGTLWNGKPWRLWVTDFPNGEGKTFFTLRFAAEI